MKHLNRFMEAWAEWQSDMLCLRRIALEDNFQARKDDDR